MDSFVQGAGTLRPIIHRTSGHMHGAITRLASPGDLGGLLKPFVFLDLFDNGGRAFPGFGLHPHSGIATLTYMAEGSITYEDTTGARGVLAEGGVEWMQAGGGVWHGAGAGRPGRARGFQLWIALPPHLELGPSASIYQDVDDVPAAGPARVLLGSHAGVSSVIESPSDINYLAVRLAAGERWRYAPPAGHGVLWVAVGDGAVATPDRIGRGELAIFAPAEAAVEFVAEADTELMLGSAMPHPHDLVLGYYSVHTSADALVKGERRIGDIRAELVRQGRLGRPAGAS